MNNEQKQLALLNLLITAFLMLGQLDELKSTNAARHRLKNLINQVVPELEKVIDSDLGLLWGVDDSAMYNLMEHFKGFIHGMATMRTEHIAGLSELLHQWKQHPQLTLYRNGIKIQESQTA
jgi:hypothetical protein